MNKTGDYQDFVLLDMVYGSEIVEAGRISERIPDLAAYVRRIRIYGDGRIRVQVADLRGGADALFSGTMKRLTDNSWAIGDSEMYFRDGCLFLAAGNEFCLGRYVPRKETAKGAEGCA